MLEESYLWLNALCMVQDDTDAKYGEMENMSAKFVNADVAIIAQIGSNAYSGLPGLQGTSSLRAYKQLKKCLHPSGRRLSY
jgi:Heterokaryon incompatibility protein (HET)